MCVCVCESQTAVEYQTEYYNISVYRVLKPLTHTWPLTADITAPSLPPVGVNPRWCYSCTAAEAEEMKEKVRLILQSSYDLPPPLQGTDCGSPIG